MAKQGRKVSPANQGGERVVRITDDEARFGLLALRRKLVRSEEHLNRTVQIAQSRFQADQADFWAEAGKVATNLGIDTREWPSPACGFHDGVQEDGSVDASRKGVFVLTEPGQPTEEAPQAEGAAEQDTEPAEVVVGEEPVEV